MDDAEIELLAGMLDQRDRIICRLEAELRQSEQQKDAIRAHSERTYMEGRRPEADERLVRMLNENDPGGSNFRVLRQ